MKIKLSKNQWEEMGKKAGWITAQRSSSIVEINKLIGMLNELKEAVNFHNSPDTSGEDKEMNASFIRTTMQNAKNAIEDVNGTIKDEILDAVSARQDDNPQPALRDIKDMYYGIR